METDIQSRVRNRRNDDIVASVMLHSATLPADKKQIWISIGTPTELHAEEFVGWRTGSLGFQDLCASMYQLASVQVLASPHDAMEMARQIHQGEELATVSMAYGGPMLSIILPGGQEILPETGLAERRS